MPSAINESDDKNGKHDTQMFIPAVLLKMSISFSKTKCYGVDNFWEFAKYIIDE